jgi:peptidoglycan LD-endopeptidase LytH
MRVPWGRIKPGWYVLAALLLYAVVATAQWRVAATALREARLQATAVVTESVAAPVAPAREATPAAASSGLWFPIPGARVPDDDAHLPNAERAYRSGVAQGFSFWAESSGVPIVHGTPVIAAGDGVVVRADQSYAELGRTEWDDLLVRVAQGADDRDLDLLRGRQVWIRLDDGRVVRYGHLAGVRSGVAVGARVARGRVIGTVGNSGTPDAVAGRTTNARLHFEVWDADAYVGQALPADEVRLAAAALFVGP